MTPKTAHPTFRINLAKYRRKSGFTQQELADRIGLQQYTINKYEAGTTEPGLYYLERIAFALGIRVCRLLD